MTTSPKRTIVPRLMQADAELDHVHIIQGKRVGDRGKGPSMWWLPGQEPEWASSDADEDDANEDDGGDVASETDGSQDAA